MLEETRTSENQALSFARQDRTALTPGGFATSPAIPAIVTRYLIESTSEATRRGYDADVRKFLAWGGSVPASADQVALYVAENAGTLTAATLSRRLAAISKAHAVLGLPSPTSDLLVHSTMRGIRRIHRRNQKQAAPLLEADMQTIIADIDPSLKGLRDRALLLLGFATACRRSELVALQMDDLADTTIGMAITIRSSKTDQFGEGRKIAIPRRADGLCAVAALEQWLQAANISAGHLFRAIDCRGKISTDGLSAQTVALVVKEYAARAGFDPARFSAHSLRAGHITNAVLAGQPTWRIKKFSGHRNDAVLNRYVRVGELLGSYGDGDG